MDLCPPSDPIPPAARGILLGDAPLRLDLPAADSRARRGLGTAAGQTDRYLYRSTDLAAMIHGRDERGDQGKTRDFERA